MVVVVAEKGLSSSWDKMPVQSMYREPHVRETYRRGESGITLRSGKSLIRLDERRRVRTRFGGKRVSDSVSYLVKRTEELGIAEAFRRAALRVVDRVRRGLGIKGRKIRGYRYVGKV
jgi:hypothetical protein